MQASPIPFPDVAPRPKRWWQWPHYAFHDHWLKSAYQRLDHVFTAAPEIAFDQTSRLVFFADTHRGTKDKGDAFAPNEPIFLHALDHYYGRGFTYIEVGDGDELWLNQQFDPIRHAYHQIFERLHRFAAERRLHLLLGNHEISHRGQSRLFKDGLEAVEGLVLRQRRTNQRLFVVHGHQADPSCDQFLTWSHYFTRFMNQWGMGSADVPEVEEASLRGRVLASWGAYSQSRIESRLRSWASLRRHILITGHTHRPYVPHYEQEPYFNTGSCLGEREITGLELVRNGLQMVKWIQDGEGQVRRIPVGTPRLVHHWLGDG